MRWLIYLAINFHAILSDTSSRYFSDAYVDLISEITSLLNQFDVALKVNGDFKVNLSAIYKETQLLAKAFEFKQI